MTYKDAIIKHYQSCWHGNYNLVKCAQGPIELLGDDFCILEFEPSVARDMWTYATCCMSNPNQYNPIELHLFSSTRNAELIVLLTAIAFYHIHTTNLGLNHTVNFGKPWQYQSKCSYGLISFPYLDDPMLEIFTYQPENIQVGFYWLLPITPEELALKKKYGVDSLEQIFENNHLNYLDVNRKSVV